MRLRFIVGVLAASLIGFAADRAGAEGRVDRNVVFGMYSGLALLMDVYHPENANGYGVVFISGSGWTRELGLDAVPLKESGQEKIYAEPLAAAGYTVFGINHRASPRFRHPAHLEDAQRAVRFVRHHAAEFGIDPDRIGAIGGSSGGHLVSLLGVLDARGVPGDASPVNRESAKVQVVVARAAPTDLTLSSPRAVHPLFGFRRSERPDTEESPTLRGRIARDPRDRGRSAVPADPRRCRRRRALRERGGHAGGAREGRRGGRVAAHPRRQPRADVPGGRESAARLCRRDGGVVRPPPCRRVRSVGAGDGDSRSAG